MTTRLTLKKGLGNGGLVVPGLLSAGTLKEGQRDSGAVVVPLDPLSKTRHTDGASSSWSAAYRPMRREGRERKEGGHAGMHARRRTGHAGVSESDSPAASALSSTGSWASALRPLPKLLLSANGAMRERERTESRPAVCRPTDLIEWPLS